MHPTLSTVRTQQKLIQTQRNNNDCYRIFNLLTSDDLLDKVEEQLPEHRERLFPPTETLAMFITQALSADRSCQNIVNQAAMQRLISGLSSCSTRTGGYCRARTRLRLSMIKNISQYVSELINDLTPDLWQWKGRDVQLVDGTTVTMPDTANNQRAYPQQRGQKPGLGFPICRIVGITSLSSGALLNAAVGLFNGKGGDEQTLLRSLQFLGTQYLIAQNS
ncbi:IS4 orf [hydrothermal vent metagenome]|uniref:IS4 orf n=1 Tax=hydrothermal vent metagenome TaxID=652676 RepID=A0A3B0WNT5_9ZZZZ